MVEPSVLQVDRQRSRVNPRQLEQVVDEPAQCVYPVAQQGQIPVEWHESVLERLQHRVDRGKRRPQIVGGPGDQLAPGVEELLNGRCHLVERATELSQLSHTFLRSASTEITTGQPCRGLVQALKRRQ